MERLTEHSKQTSHEIGICCTHFCGPNVSELYDEGQRSFFMG